MMSFSLAEHNLHGMNWKDSGQQRYQNSPKGRETKRLRRLLLGEEAWKERRNRNSREYRQRNPARLLWTNAKSRARKFGVEFRLGREDITIPDVCPVFGTPFEHGTRGNCPDAPSLDRIDNTKGYVKGNIRVISNRANAIKRDATLPELEAIVRYVKENLATFSV